MYFISVNQGQGARWTFTGSQVRELALAILSGATVSGPYEPQDTFEIKPGWDTEITYQADQMAFSFRAEDDLASTAGFVLRLLQHLAPTSPPYGSRTSPVNSTRSTSQTAALMTSPASF